jgi:hypothetical protein
MSVQIDNFFTNSFILKDEESVKYIKRLCKLLMEEDNLTSGYLSSSVYCNMFTRSSFEDNSFVISMGGFIDGGPYLLHSSVHGFDSDKYSKVEEQNEDKDPIYIFEEIQKNLKQGTWFFVDEYSWDKTKAETAVRFFHQDGRTKMISNYDIKKLILKEMRI